MSAFTLDAKSSTKSLLHVFGLSPMSRNASRLAAELRVYFFVECRLKVARMLSCLTSLSNTNRKLLSVLSAGHGHFVCFRGIASHSCLSFRTNK